MSKDKRQEIINAANECFVKYGYKKTTLEDIAAKIGLHKASLYHYFQNKEEIFSTVILDEFQQFRETLQVKLNTAMECKKKIITYFNQKHYFWFKKSVILQQITEIEPETRLRLMHAGREIYQKIETEEKKFIKKLLYECIDKNEIANIQTELVSDLLFALADGIKDKSLHKARYNQSSFSYDQLIADTETALEIFIAGLGVNSHQTTAGENL